MENFQYSLLFHVRDYECDFQGIVNNAVYLNYLEHTRHEFAKHMGLDVVNMAQQGINLVVVRAELDYKSPLRSGDAFVVGTTLERFSRVRLVFRHTIYLHETQKIILHAQIIIAAMNKRGRPCWPDELQRLFVEPV